jgi:hypothetical protein
VCSPVPLPLPAINIEIENKVASYKIICPPSTATGLDSAATVQEPSINGTPCYLLSLFLSLLHITRSSCTARISDQHESSPHFIRSSCSSPTRQKCHFCDRLLGDLGGVYCFVCVAHYCQSYLLTPSPAAFCNDFQLIGTATTLITAIPGSINVWLPLCGFFVFLLLCVLGVWAGYHTRRRRSLRVSADISYSLCGSCLSVQEWSNVPV